MRTACVYHKIIKIKLFSLKAVLSNFPNSSRSENYHAGCGVVQHRKMPSQHASDVLLRCSYSEIIVHCR